MSQETAIILAFLAAVFLLLVWYAYLWIKVAWRYMLYHAALAAIAKDPMWKLTKSPHDHGGASAPPAAAAACEHSRL